MCATSKLQQAYFVLLLSKTQALTKFIKKRISVQILKKPCLIERREI